MARLLLLISFLLPVLTSTGQPPVSVDSLEKIVRGHPARDSNRVTALLKLADATVYTDPAIAMRYADEALDISKSISWPKGIALGLRQKGNAYYVFSDNPAALDCYIRALHEAQPLGLRDLDGSLFNNLANIYCDEKQFDKGLDYYRQFLEAAREMNNPKQQTIALVNMGTVYTELGQQDKALDCGRQALSICRNAGINYYLSIILNNLGVAYNKRRMQDSALNFFAQSIAMADRFGNLDAKASSLEETGKIYLARGDYAAAGNYALQSLAIARQLQSAEWQSNAWQSLYQVYEHRRDYSKALDAYRQYILFRDSVSTDEKKSEITRKEMQFDFERKEAATRADNDRKQALAQAEIGRQALIRKVTLVGVLILLAAAIFGFVLYKRRRDAEERRKEADLKAKVSDTEMKVLRLQMNPHFIFNSLNSISDYITRHETTTANYYLSKFAKMMRQVLEHSEKSEITLAEDLQVVETYIQLELMRMRSELSYEIVVDRDIDPEATMVPPLIVQPFVENSILHGLSARGRPGRISIHVARADGMIHYIVEDNGIGRREAGKHAPAGKRSMGLRITRDRIDIINQTKQTTAGVEIIDLDEGTRVELRLPLEFNY